MSLISRAGTVVFRQDGVVVLDRKGRGCDGSVLTSASASSEWLASGRLSIKVCPGIAECGGAVILWVQDEEVSHTIQVGSGGASTGGGLAVSPGTSLPDREWAVVHENHHRGRGGGFNDGSNGGVASGDTGYHRVRPMEVEVAEIKSYRLSDDTNQVTLIQRDGTNHNPLIFLDDGPQKFLDTIKRYTSVRQSRSDENLYLLTDPRIHALDESLSQLNLLDRQNADAVWKFVADIQTAPVTTALSAFAKLTDKLIFSPVDEDVRPEEEMAELLHQSLHTQNLDVMTGGDEDGEFEVVTSRPRLTADLPEVTRNDPLCQLDWELHFDEDGNLIDIDELKIKIFKGGVDHNIRNEVWKFLLGYYDYKSSAEEREKLRKAKENEYFQMKLQWKSMTQIQEDNFSAFRERKVQVEKDISRTDRTHPFFQGEKNRNVALLQDILMTYVMYNFDLGYVQGMSDLLSPILYVMQNEVDAFWCFVGFMNRIKSNFDLDQGGIKNQLNQLIELQKAINPELYAYLDAKDSGNMYFAFRWVLIWFKREFSYDDLMKLWEILWTDLPGPNFHLILCLSLLDGEKSTIVENGFGFNEILKHVNDMSHNIDLDYNLKKAEAIYVKLKAAPPEHGINNNVRKILGMSPIPMTTTTTTTTTTNSSVSSPSISVKHKKGIEIEKRRHRSSGTTNSSSVEVLSELDDEARFENGLANSPFE